MRIFVTGASGLLGSKITELATEAGHKVISGYATRTPDYGDIIRLDIRDEKSILKRIAESKPDTIIHCAALTNVDDCESNKDLAKKINTDGTKGVAKAAKNAGAYLVYISTDYVFDGLKGLYREGDKEAPINFYGHSKLLGEKAVISLNNEFLIIRPSIIYGARSASGKTNFALWILKSLEKMVTINILTDQYVSPTLNTNLAKILLEACEKKLDGIYHMAGNFRISRYNFAIRLAEIFGLDKTLIKKVKMSDMNWIAKRPRDSSLNVSKANMVLKTKLMNLNDSIGVLKEEIKLAARN
ncbi:MAG: dTDP-4-dehydrorhamnose reductase [Candidatus Bathyarchaeota archaeon]|nr:dTDP-4-dehydrorhamnose reductase [Candidatus Bathyarchaeota archaeon]